MTDYIDLNNRHLCDPNKEYCVLNLDLDGIPYHGYIVFYHRTQKNLKQLELKDRGEAIQQELAQEGWKIVHQYLVRGGIYKVIHYERPKPITNPSQPRIIGPMDKAHMQDGMEYAYLLFYRGKDEAFVIEFYDKQSHRKTDLMRGISHGDILAQMKTQGWQQTYGTGDAEGVVNYFQRRKSPVNNPNWIPVRSQVTSMPTITHPSEPSLSVSESKHDQTSAHITPTDTYERHIIMIGGEQRILQHEGNSQFIEIIENGASKRQIGNIQHLLTQAIADGWIHLVTQTSPTKIIFILGRNGQAISPEHISPEHHTQLPDKIRITRIEDLGDELKVSAYDNQKVDNLRNQKKSLAEFVITMKQSGEWQLIYEAQEAGHRVIYLGRIMP
ncbi:MAG: hypothetical protein CUN52_02355 [Phototrophicales bacterium]|nr:MAG: hypothetical protein CUN52_02355 [Phototrophicales bacterium]